MLKIVHNADKPEKKKPGPTAKLPMRCPECGSMVAMEVRLGAYRDARGRARGGKVSCVCGVCLAKGLVVDMGWLG